MRHTALFAAALVLASGAAGIQPTEVENTTLRLELNTSEVFRSGTQTTPGEYTPSSYPYLSSSKPEALVPYGDTTEVTNIYMPNGLVAYYPLDETTGNTANDITTTLPNNDGTHISLNQNDIGVEGNISTAYNFDGSNDYVELADTPNMFSGSDDFTIVTRGNHDVVNTGTPQQLITPSEDNQFELREDGNGEVIFGWWDGSTFKHGLDFAVSSNKWYYTAVTWDADQNVTLYKNGVAKDSTYTDSSPTLTIDTAAIGQKGDDSNWFNGTIDDVRIYNRSLSQKEVQRLYNYQNKNQPGTEQISATITSGGFILTNTKGGTPSIESQSQTVNSRTFLSQVSPSFAFQQQRGPPTTQIVYRSPHNLTGDSFSSASSGISLRSTKGLGENATVSVKPIG